CAGAVQRAPVTTTAGITRIRSERADPTSLGSAFMPWVIVIHGMINQVKFAGRLVLFPYWRLDSQGYTRGQLPLLGLKNISH
ncbi:MAG: hypothetical protein ACYDBI_09920, partial [Thermoplasmataceae archaeon]